ncbi:MAG: transposase [Spirochaetia bacterium]|nr:transposase [Spirochaetia bacterium]
MAVRSFGEDEMILATNTEKTEKEILEIYLTRWKCEESFRFLKNEYNLEDARVRSYVAIRNVAAILHTVFYFLSVELGIKLAYSIVVKKVMEKAKRFFEVTIFKQYALADGIGRILLETGWEGMRHREQKTKPADDAKI